MNDEAFCKHNVQINRNNFFIIQVTAFVLVSVKFIEIREKKRAMSLYSHGKRKLHPLFILLFYISGMKNNLV